jgi:hypothetical protein
MLTAVVDDVNKTVPQLPNLLAVRETTRFDDQPQEDQFGSTGLFWPAAMPLHQVGNFSLTGASRDQKEVADEKALKHYEDWRIDHCGRIRADSERIHRIPLRQERQRINCKTARGTSIGSPCCCKDDSLRYFLPSSSSASASAP